MADGTDREAVDLPRGEVPRVRAAERGEHAVGMDYHQTRRLGIGDRPAVVSGAGVEVDSGEGGHELAHVPGVSADGDGGNIGSGHGEPDLEAGEVSGVNDRGGEADRPR